MGFDKTFNQIIDDKFYNSLKEQIKKLDKKTNTTQSYNEKIKYTEQALELSLKLYEHSKSNGYSDYWIKNFNFDSDENDVISHRDSLEFYKVYSLYQQALVLEKDKKQSKALEIYLYILENFIPKGTVYYERPAMILEKQKLYDQAIEVCNKAIKAINQKLFNADVDDFNHRIQRLIKKLSK